MTAITRRWPAVWPSTLADRLRACLTRNGCSSPRSWSACRGWPRPQRIRSRRRPQLRRRLPHQPPTGGQTTSHSDDSSRIRHGLFHRHANTALIFGVGTGATIPCIRSTMISPTGRACQAVRLHGDWPSVGDAGCTGPPWRRMHSAGSRIAAGAARRQRSDSCAVSERDGRGTVCRGQSRRPRADRTACRPGTRPRHSRPLRSSIVTTDGKWACRRMRSRDSSAGRASAIA
jgi:hypothetical protein